MTRAVQQTAQEYYRFGESTWDLFLFIGTGALGPDPQKKLTALCIKRYDLIVAEGPLGSCQTFVLAVVNVIMLLSPERHDRL